MSASNGNSLEAHQAILIKHWERLEKLCECICLKHNKLYLADDMFCEAVIDKSERAYQSFDPKRNDNIEGYMLQCFRYYCYDWISKYFKKMKHKHNAMSATGTAVTLLVDDKSSGKQSDLAYEESAALVARDEVIAILGVLPSFERRLLTLRFGYSWTFPEIAKALQQPESSVRVACNEALLKAQWYAKQRIKRNIV